MTLRRSCLLALTAAATACSTAPAPTDADGRLLAELAAIERGAWNAWQAGDPAFYDRALLPAAAYVGSAGIEGKEAIVAQVERGACSVPSWDIDGLRAVPLSDAAAMLIGRASYAYDCGGAVGSARSWFSTGFTRVDGAWRIAFHQETAVTPAPPSLGGIDSVLEAMTVAWNRDDLAGHVAPYTDSASYTMGSGLIVGRDTIHATTNRYWGRPDGLAGTLSFSDVRVVRLGSRHALVTGAFLVAGVQPGRDARGRFTLVMEHGPGGWRIVHDHSS